MTVALSNLDRVLWPSVGFTKGDMIEYYDRVAPVLLPHIRRRPLTLWRFPHGVHHRGWWQNECRGAPGWMTVAHVRGQRFCVVDDEASLRWVANQGTIELHPFLARLDDPETPTGVLFDLDPAPPATRLECCDVALVLRRRLSIDSFAKTSGGSGLHVIAPLNSPHRFEETKTFARNIANELARELPELVVTAQRRDLRAGKVLVDWLQNDATRTTVAPYSLRAAPRPCVSTPVTWEEVEDAAHKRRDDALTFTADDVLRRVQRDGDIFAPLLERRQRLAA